MKKQPEITDATRQELISAFWSLYEKKRIEEIRIKEITDLAHYHRGTFYEYFMDIYDLLNREEEGIIRQILDEAPELQSVGMDDLIKQIADIYLRIGNKLCLLIGEGGDPQFMHKLRNTLYQAFLKNKTLPSTSAISIVFDFTIHGLIMAFYSWYTSKDRLPVDNFLKIVRLLTEKGIPQCIESVVRM